MKLLKGLYTDSQPIDQPEGTWRNAKNITVSKKLGAINNEDGFFKIVHTNNNIGYPVEELRPIGFITLDNNTTVIFSVSNVLNQNISEMGILREEAPKVRRQGYFLEKDIATSFSAGTGQTLFEAGLFYTVRIRVTNNQPTDYLVQIPQSGPYVSGTTTEDVEHTMTITDANASILITNSNSGNPITVEIVATKVQYYERVIRDTFLNFSSGYPIQGVYKKSFKEDTIIAFTDKYNPPRILNLDNPAMVIDQDGHIANATKADLLELYVKVAVPSITVQEISDAGGQLDTGTYFPAIAYELEDGGVSNTAVVGNPVFIYDDGRLDTFTQVDGSPAGIPTSKSIRFEITNVDTRYHSIRLYMIKMLDQIVSSDLVGTFDITGTTSIIEYSGTEVVDAVPLEEILVNKAVYSRVGTMTNYLNRLYLADLEITLLMDYQKYANNITAAYCFEDEISIDKVKGSAKDSVFMFLDRSFQNDEVYAYYITPILTSGVRAPAFHIPGRAASADVTDSGQAYTDTDLIDDLSTIDTYLLEDAKLADNVRYFQTRDTSRKVTADTGEMGYWDNSSEYYPTGVDSQVWEGDGSGGGRQKTTGEITLANTNVRHHKFPSMRNLVKYLGGPMYTSGNADLGGITIGTSNFLYANTTDFVEGTVASNSLQKWFRFRGASTMTPAMGTIIDTPLPPTGIGTLEGTGYVAAQDQDITIVIDGTGSVSPILIRGEFSPKETAHKIVSVHFRIRKLDANNGLISTLYEQEKDNRAWQGTESSENYTDSSAAPSSEEYEDPDNPSPDPTQPTEDADAVGGGEELFPTDDEGGDTQEPATNVFQESDPANPTVFDRVSPVTSNDSPTSTTGDEVFQTSFEGEEDSYDPDIGSHEVQMVINPKTINTFVGEGQKIVFDVWVDFGGSPGGNDIAQFEFQSSGFIHIGSVTPAVLASSDLRGRRLGIKFSNIYFPDSILEKIQGFEISYARRTIRNQTIIGQSPLLPYDFNNGTNFPDLVGSEGQFIASPWRWYGFDSMATKSNLFPTHFTQQVTLKGEQVDTGKEVIDWTGQVRPFGGITNPPPPIPIDDQYLYEAGSQDDYLRVVKNVNYLATDNSLATPNNEKREECMAGEMDLDLDPPSSVNPLPRWFSNGVAYKQNIYQSKDEQELVSVGRVWRTTEGQNIYETGAVYGGDTFIAERGLYTFGENGKGLNTGDFFMCYLWIGWGALNSSLRHAGEEWFEYYYRDTDLAIPAVRRLQIPDGTVDPENPDNLMGPSDGAPIAQVDSFLKSFSEHYGYNNDYTAINQYPLSIPYTGAPSIENFPTRIARSEISPETETEESWRNFLLLDVYDQERKRGAIHHLEAFKDQLIIQHLRGTYITRGTQQIKTDLVAAYLGTGDLFSNPPTEVTTSKEGYAGNRSSWATIVTKAGLFFIDSEQGKVFLLGNELDEISNKGNREWFRSNLPGSRNNPFFADGYVATYDERYNRILLTKRGVGSFTVSYSFDFNAWICYHDYLPSAMWSTRRKVYSYAHQGDQAGILVQHNDKRVKGRYYENGIVNYEIVSTAEEAFPGEPGISMKLDVKYGDVRTYFDVPQINITLDGVKVKYNVHSFLHPLWNGVNTFIVVQGTWSGESQTGTAYSSVLPRNTLLDIRPSFIEPVFTDEEKQWFNIAWKTEVLDANLVNQHNQTLTGILVYTLRQCSGEKILTPLVNTRRTKSGWRTKDFRDIVIDKSKPFFDPQGALIPSNLSLNGTYWKKRRFQDNYLIVRFIYDNVGDNNLYLYNVNTDVREQIR